MRVGDKLRVTKRDREERKSEKEGDRRREKKEGEQKRKERERNIEKERVSEAHLFTHSP